MENTWILYQTTNNVNGKVYIGVHRLQNTSYSKNYLGSGKGLKQSIKKYGKENFSRTTLAEFNCAKDAYLAEKSIVTEDFVNLSDTYNMKVGGEGGIGLVHTLETKAKLSACNTGKIVLEETKAKLSVSLKGREFSEETRQKISDAKKGNKNRLDKPHTKETKQKISIGNKGKIRSEEAIKKYRDAKKGNQYRLDKTHTDEAKAKMSAASPNSIPIIVEGKYYESAEKAALDKEVSPSTILNRVRSSSPKFADYIFAPIN
jgi:group I intron endonuclease